MMVSDTTGSLRGPKSASFADRAALALAEAIIPGCASIPFADEATIADASTVPGPLGVNPQVTIMAMATRAADHIAEQVPRAS